MSVFLLLFLGERGGSELGIEWRRLLVQSCTYFLALI